MIAYPSNNLGELETNILLSTNSCFPLAFAVAEGEEPEVDAAEGSEAAAPQSRAEKKARKALSKLSLAPVAGVNRVTIKKSKTILFIVDKADVLKSPIADTYVVFGAVRIEDLSQTGPRAGFGGAGGAGGLNIEALRALAQQNPQIAAALEQEGPGGLQAMLAAAGGAGGLDGAAGGGDDDDDGVEAGAGGEGSEIAEDDVQLLMRDRGVTRERAVEALKDADGDLVNAIMALEE